MFYTAYERASEHSYDRMLDSCGQDTRRHPPNIVLPRFCRVSRWCEQPPLHLGPCDPLELIEVPYSTFISNNPKKANMKLEAPPNTNSNFVKFERIGDSVKGVFVSYGEVNGNFGPKKELVLRTKDGPKNITCTAHLRQIIDANLEKIRGKVLTITLRNLKAVGKPQPMKEFEVDVSDPKSGKAEPPPPAREPGDDSDQEADPF